MEKSKKKEISADKLRFMQVASEAIADQIRRVIMDVAKASGTTPSFPEISSAIIFGVLDVIEQMAQVKGVSVEKAALEFCDGLAYAAQHKADTEEKEGEDEQKPDK